MTLPDRITDCSQIPAQYKVWRRLCEENLAYRAAFAEGRGPGQRQDGQPPPKNGRPVCKRSGPGTELTKLFRPVRRLVRKTCPCKNHAREMDRRGCDWCEKNIAMILSWLEEEAKLSGLPYSEIVVRRIVNLAIRRARRREKRCAKSCPAV